MTIKEAAERYRIPEEILDEYESWGFCGKNDGNIGVRQYDQTDIERLSLIMTLHDVGFQVQKPSVICGLLYRIEILQKSGRKCFGKSATERLMKFTQNRNSSIGSTSCGLK